MSVRVPCPWTAVDVSLQVASQKAAYGKAVKEADALIRNPEVKRLLALTTDAATAWGQQVGDIEARAGTDQASLAEAMEIVRKGTSNKLLGTYRSAHAALVEAESKLMGGVKAQEADVADMMVRVMLGGGIASVAVALLFCWLLTRAVARPITCLTGTMQDLASGDLNVAVPDVGHGDEIGAMARAVQ